MIKVVPRTIVHYWFWMVVGIIWFVPNVLWSQADSSYEITSHRFSLHLYPTEAAFRCSDTIDVHRLKLNEDDLKLFLVPLYTVTNVTVDGRNKDFRLTRDAFRILDVPDDTAFTVIVHYSGQLNFRSEFTQISRDRAVLREEEILPTGPKAYRFVRMNVTVPRDWKAFGIGKPVGEQTQADSTTFLWEYDQPLPNIGWICAGKYTSNDVTSDNLSISTHLLPDDSSAALRLQALAKDVLKFYNSKFSPYRFSRLSIIEVGDWLAGRNVLAIAAPSFIMVKRLAFTTDDPFNQVEAILPHEIAHQWWPAAVFIEEKDAAFLSEGLCEYSALLYAEASGNMTKRDSLADHPLLRPLIMRAQQGRDVPLQQRADLRAMPTHYLKASYVHHMLRKLIGDSLFQQLYRQYAERYEGRIASLADFQRLAEEIAGRSLSWFFEQWVRQRGIPRMKIYNVKAVQSGNEWMTRGRVRMVGYDKYTSRITVGAELPDKAVVSSTVMIGTDSAGKYQNDVPFEIHSNAKPLRALLDPHGDVLKYRRIPPKFGDLREPNDGIFIIGTGDTSNHLRSIAMRDSAELERGGWSITIKHDTAITLADLQRERVVLYGKPAENRIAADLEAKFFHRIAGDSIRVNGGGVGDSTLSLLQIIESPYIAQGLLVWIAPLTPAARPELLPFDHSWVVLRGKDEVSAGTWDVKDGELVVEVK